MADPSKQSAHQRQFKLDRPAPLLEYLLSALAPMKRTRVKELLRFGAVSVNGCGVTQFDHPLKAGDVVAIGKPQTVVAKGALERSGISILYEDDVLILIDKPEGMLTIGTEKQKFGTVHHLVNEYLRKDSSNASSRAFIVHRLDRETSGILLLAKSALIQQRLQSSWAETEKSYIAIVEGKPEPAENAIRSYLIESSSLRVYSGPPGNDAKLAITHYHVVQTADRYSRVEIQLETGRKHQIRVHMAELGTPIVGDPKYQSQTNPLGRLCLHAWKLRFIHPTSGERMEFAAEIPVGFQKLVVTSSRN